MSKESKTCGVSFWEWYIARPKDVLRPIADGKATNEFKAEIPDLNNNEDSIDFEQANDALQVSFFWTLACAYAVLGLMRADALSVITGGWLGATAVLATFPNAADVGALVLLVIGVVSYLWIQGTYTMVVTSQRAGQILQSNKYQSNFGWFMGVTMLIFAYLASEISTFQMAEGGVVVYRTWELQGVNLTLSVASQVPVYYTWNSNPTDPAMVAGWVLFIPCLAHWVLALGALVRMYRGSVPGDWVAISYLSLSLVIFYFFISMWGSACHQYTAYANNSWYPYEGQITLALIIFMAIGTFLAAANLLANLHIVAYITEHYYPQGFIIFPANGWLWWYGWFPTSAIVPVVATDMVEKNLI